MLLGKQIRLTLLLFMLATAAFGQGDFKLTTSVDASKPIHLDNLKSIGFRWEKADGQSSLRYRMAFSLTGSFDGSDDVTLSEFASSANAAPRKGIEDIPQPSPRPGDGKSYSWNCSLMASEINRQLSESGKQLTGEPVDVYFRCEAIDNAASANAEPAAVSNVLHLQLYSFKHPYNPSSWYVVDFFGVWLSEAWCLGKYVIPMNPRNGTMPDRRNGLVSDATATLYIDKDAELSVVDKLNYFEQTAATLDVNASGQGVATAKAGGNKIVVAESGWYRLHVATAESGKGGRLTVEKVEEPGFGFESVELNGTKMTATDMTNNRHWYMLQTFEEDTEVAFTANGGSVAFSLNTGDYTVVGDKVYSRFGSAVRCAAGEDSKITVPAGNYSVTFNINDMGNIIYVFHKLADEETSPYSQNLTLNEEQAPIELTANEYEVAMAGDDSSVRLFDLKQPNADLSSAYINFGSSTRVNLYNDLTLYSAYIPKVISVFGKEAMPDNSAPRQAPGTKRKYVDAFVDGSYNNDGTEYLARSATFRIYADADIPYFAECGFYVIGLEPILSGQQQEMDFDDKSLPMTTVDGVNFYAEIPVQDDGWYDHFVVVPGVNSEYDCFSSRSSKIIVFKGNNSTDKLSLAGEFFYLPWQPEAAVAYALTMNVADMTYHLEPIFDNTGVAQTTLEPLQTTGAVYDMQGRKVAEHFNRSALRPGIYLCSGKKFVVR